MEILILIFDSDSDFYYNLLFSNPIKWQSMTETYINHTIIFDWSIWKYVSEKLVNWFALEIS